MALKAKFLLHTNLSEQYVTVSQRHALLEEVVVISAGRFEITEIEMSPFLWYAIKSKETLPAGAPTDISSTLRASRCVDIV